MKLYIEELKRFKKNKLLWIALAIYIIYSLAGIFRYEYSVLDVNDALDPTNEILFLCTQIFIIYLIIGYEFLSEQYRAGMNESIAATAAGYTGRNIAAAFMVLTTVLFVNYIVFTGFDIVITNAIFAAKAITEANGMASLYIAKSLFINIFLIGLIGISAALLISKLQKRITAYAIITAVIFASSYMMSEIANMVLQMHLICEFGFGKISEILNININSVKTRYYRGLNALKKEFMKLETGGEKHETE